VEKLKILIIYEKSILSPKSRLIRTQFCPADCSCPNEPFFRTLFSLNYLFLAVSTSHSASPLLLLPVPVRINSSFGLCSGSITCSCPNQLLIRTLLSFYYLFLSKSTPHSDSPLLLLPVPVRINSSFRHPFSSDLLPGNLIFS